MRIKSWLLTMAGVLALAATWPSAAVAWPNTGSAQPLVQASRICAPNIVALYRRCRVLDFAPLGQTRNGRRWYYAFFSTHWADRHGRIDRGFPIIFYLEGPATLRLGLWLNDEPGLAGHWAVTAPARPLLIQRPEADYLAFTLRISDDLVDQRLYRQNPTNKKRWRKVEILHRTDADQRKLDSATPGGCEAADDGYYDWSRFELVQALRHALTHAPCGYLTAGLKVSGERLDVTTVTYHKDVAKPASADARAPAASSAPPRIRR